MIIGPKQAETIRRVSTLVASGCASRGARALTAWREVLGRHRQTLLAPRRPPTLQGPRLLPSSSTKLSRHPGACGFVRSRTVQNERGVLV